jgi:predicted house-cleaning noncanonical NTP pyrophosphatase (MazG superfamily)
LQQPDCHDFEKNVITYLLRHQSILDIMSKYQETCARTNRALIKSVTACGCLKIKAQKQPLPPEATINDLKELFSNHLNGELCDNCREIIITELGKNLFYITALCNTLGINLQEIITAENSKVKTLGKFNMT